MSEEPENILKKPLKGWRAVLAALLLIALTPLLVVTTGVLVMGLRVGQEEWKRVAWATGIVIGCGLLLISLIAAIRWLCCWRNLRRILLSFALLATLIAIFYTEEDWRGKHAWNNYVREQAVKGEKLDLSAFTPPPVPDDQNFCMCPLLKPILDLRMVDRQVTWRDTNGFARVQALSPWLSDHSRPAVTNGLIGWQAYYRSLTNLSDLSLGNSLSARFQSRYGIRAAKQRTFIPNLSDLSLTNSPAEDVLLVLRRFEPALAELKREAAQRPLDRWPIQYEMDSPWGTLLPHLAHAKGICYLLQLRATAYLATGDAASAISDLQLGFRLANSVRTEPFLISHLVRNACYDVLLQPPREGLGRHQLSEAELSALQREFTSVDLLAGYQLGNRGERAVDGAWVKLTWAKVTELTRDVPSEFAQPFYSFGVFSRVAPKGWIYQNELTLCRIYDDYILPAVDPANRTVRPERARAITIATRQAKGPYSILVSLLFQPESFFGKLRSQCDRFAYAQTQIDEASIACALERYHLAHGEYPETMDALAPGFIDKLPHDLINGQPLHYRRTSDGSFLLYSVGWNESDDGGVTVRNRDGQVDIEKGDWAWR